MVVDYILRQRRTDQSKQKNSSGTSTTVRYSCKVITLTTCENRSPPDCLIFHNGMSALDNRCAVTIVHTDHMCVGQLSGAHCGAKAQTGVVQNCAFSWTEGPLRIL